VPHLFQPYYDPDRKNSGTAWMARPIYGRLSDVWRQLVARQQKGAAIAVTMAESEGRDRKKAIMVRPRAVWIEADGPLRRGLPLTPNIVVETSPASTTTFTCAETSAGHYGMASSRRSLKTTARTRKPGPGPRFCACPALCTKRIPPSLT
jgi:hypothetical protein